MTHSLHRYGPEEHLLNDYTFFARASAVNLEGCGPKLQKILAILLSEDPVNFGSSALPRCHAGGLTAEEFTDFLKKSVRIACVFSSREKIRRVLQKLKEGDFGLSIVVGGLIREIVEISREIGLKPHTANISLGIHGTKKHLLPPGDVLEITTMCGHGMVATKLAQRVLKDLKAGRITPQEGARLLARQCPCGLVNTDRFDIIFAKAKEADMEA